MGTSTCSRPRLGSLNLSDRGELIGFLRRHGLSPEKALGQHFLCSSKVTQAIVAAVGQVASVLEIGPGPGSLTSILVQHWPVTAVEIDERMIAILADSSPGAKVIRADVLRTDLGNILDEQHHPRAVVSNMPYNITGPLLSRIADVRAQWDVAVLMMQREVGQKILALPGDRVRGALSVRMQMEFEVTRVCSAPAGAFLPPPKVESIVLKLVPRKESYAPGFFLFVHQGFTQPRKTVANNLLAGGFDRSLLDAAELPPDIRPHQLDEQDWLNLYRLSESYRLSQ